jgi:hypothetical protein
MMRLVVPLVLALISSPLRAEEAGASAEVLVVSDGAVGTAIARYDIGDLRAMRQVTYRTSTVWTSGVRVWQGVPLAEVVRAAGLSGTLLRLHAANDYEVVLPLAELGPDVPIIAYLVDGQPMTLRQKGPLWVVYPYDSDPDYRSEVTLTRSVWQLEEITVLP